METIEQTITRLKAFILEKAPDTDLSPGSVLNELLIGLTAQAQNNLQNTVDDISASKTIQLVIESATDTFNPVIDALASNYNTYRNQGSFTTGAIKVTVNTNKTYYIPQWFTFIQPSLNFNYRATKAYVISATSTPALISEGGGYYFVLPVQSSDIGAEQQVIYGTAFELSANSSLPEIISAVAASSFETGANIETDKELITRFKLGLSTKNLISYNSIETVLKDNYPSFHSLSVRGTGDPENIRTGNNPFGITLPGMVDVYIRTCYALPVVTMTLSGTKIDSNKWSVTIPATAAPGFYNVVSIINSGGTAANSLVVDSTTYSYDTTLYTGKNNVTSTEEARFSKYQTATVTFLFSSTETSQNFNVSVLAQPYLSDIQQLFLDSSTRIPCADYLVKGVVPCNVSLSVHLVGLADYKINIPKIQIGIFKYINELPIGSPINVSNIVSICHQYPITRVDLPITVIGTIYSPFSTVDNVITISGTDTLEIPNNPELGVTPNTCAFFANYFDADGNATIAVTTD